MLEAGLLAAVVAIMAAVSTAVGPVGGVVFATMAIALPAPAVVPVHAALQAGGSVMRTVVLRSFVDRRAVGVFVLSGLAGIVPAALVVSRLQLDEAWLRLGLGVATLGPVLIKVGQAKLNSRPSRATVAGLGLSTSFLTVFVGATGPVVGAVLGRVYHNQRDRVATHTTCICFQHMAKLAVYGVLGFSYRRYLPLLGGLLLASTAGTLAGRRLLVLADNRLIGAAFQILVLGLGVLLIVTSVITLHYRAIS